MLNYFEYFFRRSCNVLLIKLIFIFEKAVSSQKNLLTEREKHSRTK
jgi:hypothetical protein